jgi:hypothetical protein
VRWSANYDQTVLFYRDMIGLPVLETFHDSYGLDGTILGLLLDRISNNRDGGTCWSASRRTAASSCRPVSWLSKRDP